MNEVQRRTAPGRNGKNGGTAAKSFVCDHDGCGKRFTRLEHLNRHALNHTAGEATCPRCRAHFKRPDLLARHMDRHQKRDEETGGTGILKTRKRSWKQADGKIVDKRPASRQPPGEQPSQGSTAPNAIPTTIAEGPISPPVSQESCDLSFSDPSTEHFQDTNLAFHPEEVVPPPVPLFSSTYPPITDATGDSFWGNSIQSVTQGSQNTVDFLYDEAFQPDTASSFNMPYTTATNYNWLFDLNNDIGMENNIDLSPVQEQPHSEYPQPPFQRLPDMPDMSMVPQHPTPESSARGMQPMESPIYGSQGSATNDPSLMPAPGSNSIESLEFQSASSDLGLSSDPSRHQASSSLLDALELERPLSMLQRPKSLPCIDECTREDVLDLIESFRPISPEDGPVTRDNKYLSLSSLQTYLDLFFTRFNTAYPLTHQATFVASNVDPLLLLSILLLGATYSSKGAHQLAVCIHDVMRPGIFSHASFSARPELWVLETILLVECFGKSRAGQKQHDMSHLFHGLLINLIRRSDCQTVQPIGPDQAESSQDDLEVVWRRWAEAEQKKRLVLLCFLWDTQHAVLFCQSLCMSSFELRLPLPSSQSLWEAQTALEWKSHAATYTPEPQFLPTLKSYLTPSIPRPARLNCLSRVLILHGLMSIFWDMQRRDQTSLGVIPGSSGNGLDTWRDRLARAYDTWKTDFDNHYVAISNNYMNVDPTGAGSSLDDARQEFAVFATSYNAIYHSAQVLLNADFLDLQIYAGARHILGKPVQRSDYVRSERVVSHWAATSKSQRRSFAAAQAAWHAATLLRDASQNLENFDSMGLFHVPWCLYLATLTCWAFHHSGQSSVDGEMTEEIIWDARAEMRNLVTSMAESRTPREVALRQGRERTGGLVWVMANALERVRWGIIHSSVMVLRGLVPWRLINQYESV